MVCSLIFCSVKKITIGAFIVCISDEKVNSLGWIFACILENFLQDKMLILRKAQVKYAKIHRKTMLNVI